METEWKDDTTKSRITDCRKQKTDTNKNLKRSHGTPPPTHTHCFQRRITPMCTIMALKMYFLI